MSLLLGGFSTGKVVESVCSLNKVCISCSSIVLIKGYRHVHVRVVNVESVLDVSVSNHCFVDPR